MSYNLNKEFIPYVPYTVLVLNKLYTIKYMKVKYSFDAKPTCNNISVIFTNY
jgi:hypothetical protein